ncbi:MAG: DUF4255 domain-containing protein [Anaerolineae bacterium]|nr:DUF4255 domain-containing protein [Anaerolineae bacterium]
MGNLQSIYSVGNSIINFLRNTYPDDLRNSQACEFRLLSSGEMASLGNNIGTTLSLYLYRVMVNEHMRHTSRQRTPNPNDIPLSVDLHYLMTVWADSALTEQLIMAWAMRQLYMFPVLDRSALSPEANWDIEDQVQVILAEMSTEDLMRIWDALDPPYHLSVSYVARVVRIDVDPPPESRPVVATRYTYMAHDPTLYQFGEEA